MGKFILFLFLSLIPVKVTTEGVPDSLKKAGKFIDRIYWEQSCGSGCAQYLSEIKDEENRKLFNINFGPFNRFTGEPLIEGVNVVPGTGNYPEGMSVKELKDFIEKHPELEEEIKSPYTVVVKEGDGFRAVPFSEKFSRELKEISRLLASVRTGNGFLDEYLHKRSGELLTDKYKEGDALWLKIKNGISAYIGPCVVEDPILGVKVAYGEAVYEIDKGWTKLGEKIAGLLPEFQKRLPVSEIRNLKPGEYPGLQVVDLKYASGVLKVPPISNFVVLPPEIPDRARKILFKNIIFQKYENVFSKIGEKVINGWKSDKNAWLLFLIAHDISHYLGSFQTSSGAVPWDKFKGKNYFILEEIKADASAVYFVGYLSRMGIVSSSAEVYKKNYLVHLLYYASKNKRAAIAQLNFLLMEGGIRLKNDGKIELLDGFDRAITRMLKEALEMELAGKRSKLLEMKKISFGLEDIVRDYSKFDFYMKYDIK